MISPYNNNSLKLRRKGLRKKETSAEKRLWAFLRNKKFNNLKFYRQYSIGGYILDFYCPKIRLAVELDGDQHKEKESVLCDKTRSDYLDLLNIRTIRFWNYEILKNTKEVLTRIKQKIAELGDPPLI